MTSRHSIPEQYAERLVASNEGPGNGGSSTTERLMRGPIWAAPEQCSDRDRTSRKTREGDVVARQRAGGLFLEN